MFLQQLKTLIKGHKKKYTLQELLEHFESNNIAVFLVLVTFLTSITLVPWGGGIETTPSGCLSFILALEGLLGFKTVYIPSFFKDYIIDIGFIQKSKKTKQTIQWIESHISHHRFQWAFNGLNEKIMYLLVLANSILMILPVIFTHLIPSLSITFLSLAWLVGDGLFFLIMIVVSFLVFTFYALFFTFFAKFLHSHRRYWTFGLWK